MDRETYRERVVSILKNHQGKDRAIKANALHILVSGEIIVPGRASQQTRFLRNVVRDIRKEKELPIISGSAGYWLAESDSELYDYTQKLLRTAVRTFGLAKDLSGVPIDHMIEQFKLDLNEEELLHEH